MDLKLAARTCLVTGASTGIGRATAVCLAAEGAQVIGTARSVAALDATAGEIERLGGRRLIVLAADLSRPGSARQLAAELDSRCGGVDVLVNNAGGSRPLSDPDDETAWAEAAMLNYRAARELSQRLLPFMLARRWGRIVNVTGAILAKTMNAAVPAKAALESWSKAAAATCAASGVTINCVAPGRVNTVQILERLHPSAQSRQDFIDRNIPMGRFGEPEEVASVIAFLASEAAAYVTAATIPVDGGALRFAF